MGFCRKIAIDPGTRYTRVADVETGELIEEPTLAAMSLSGESIEAVGAEAECLLRGLPGKYVALRPMEAGTITDIDVFEIYIQKMIKKLRRGGLSLLPLRAYVAAGSGMSDMQRGELRSAICSAARDVVLIEKPMAAAAGAGEDTGGASALMVLSMGAGVTETAVICLGRIISYRMTPMGGDAISAEIAAQARRSLDVMVGRASAERLKHIVGANGDKGSSVICAKNLMTGLPLMANIEHSLAAAAVRECAGRVADTVKQMLSGMPNELYADVVTRGVLVTGGCSRIKGLRGYMENILGIPVRMDAEPELSVIRGVMLAGAAEEWRHFFSVTERGLTQT